MKYVPVLKVLTPLKCWLFHHWNTQNTPITFMQNHNIFKSLNKYFQIYIYICITSINSTKCRLFHHSNTLAGEKDPDVNIPAKLKIFSNLLTNIFNNISVLKLLTALLNGQLFHHSNTLAAEKDHDVNIHAKNIFKYLNQYF